MTDYAEYIKERVSIVDVVERAGVNLKHNKACCPFHHEKTPSFSIHPTKNIFKCFGCGVGGDVIEFTKLFYKTDFIGAGKILNDAFGSDYSSHFRSGRISYRIYESYSFLPNC